MSYIDTTGKRGQRCLWINENGLYETECKRTAYSIQATIFETGFKYCPYCGRKIIELIFSEEMQL